MFGTWYIYNPSGFSSVGGASETLKEAFAWITYHVHYYKTEGGYPNLGIIEITKLCDHCEGGKVKTHPKRAHSGYKDCKHCEGSGTQKLPWSEQDAVNTFLRQLWIDFHKDELKGEIR